VLYKVTQRFGAVDFLYTVILLRKIVAGMIQFRDPVATHAMAEMRNRRSKSRLQLAQCTTPNIGMLPCRLEVLCVRVYVQVVTTGACVLSKDVVSEFLVTCQRLECCSRNGLAQVFAEH
jgi:hypothetical protein